MGDNEVTIPLPESKDVTTIVQAPHEELDHVVAHEGRLTTLEGRLEQQRVDVFEAIERTRQELSTAIENSRQEQASMLEGKLTRLEELANKLEQQVVTVPQESIDTVNAHADVAVPLVPEVEKQEQQVQQQIVPKGIRLRRKQRHGTKHN